MYVACVSGLQSTLAKRKKVKWKSFLHLLLTKMKLNTKVSKQHYSCFKIKLNVSSDCHERADTICSVL